MLEGASDAGCVHGCFQWQHASRSGEAGIAIGRAGQKSSKDAVCPRAVRAAINVTTIAYAVYLTHSSLTGQCWIERGGPCISVNRRPSCSVTRHAAVAVNSQNGGEPDEIIATVLHARGPWLLQARVGSEEARQLGGNGQLAESSAPSRCIGPVLLRFNEEMRRRPSDRGPGTVIEGSADLVEGQIADKETSQIFSSCAFWTLQTVPEDEAIEFGVDLNSAILELSLRCQDGLPAPLASNNKIFPWEEPLMYIPKQGMVTVFMYLSASGDAARIVGESAVTVDEQKLIVLAARKIIGTVTSFLPAALARVMSLN